jgi:subtilisin-like proprotein convertase family protein
MTTLKASTARVRAGNRSIREFDVEVEVERTPRGDLTVDLYFNDPNDGARIVIRSEDVEAFIAAAKGA